MSIRTSTQPSSLVEVLDRVLDKGVVVDLWAKVSLVGIELLAVEARVVIASVDTWLKYADAVGLLQPTPAPVPA
ncbi:gas vesicle structural protein GvpA [Carboxydochorda subterranea]|uniref:Gas vesicle protein A n=1 Tax=Carboxydichorda subterranea TaxID=3109565 RepID=A0ABZ1BXI5_9FIRM|nr:gas vesicle structural protein GvpA [Limnochorda sp. L945t]WRP17423.1 gas vesicle structural protein GvpA [Limnochorda sp. L945t]